MVNYSKLAQRISELTSDYMMCDQNFSRSRDEELAIRIKVAGLIFALAKKAVRSAPTAERRYAIHVWSFLAQKNYHKQLLVAYYHFYLYFGFNTTICFSQYQNLKNKRFFSVFP